MKDGIPRLFGRGRGRTMTQVPVLPTGAQDEAHTLLYITPPHIVSSDSLHCALPGSRILSRCGIHITFSTAVSDLAQLLQPSYCV